MKLNLPNKITLSRIFLIPVFMFFYLASFIPFAKIISAVIFILAVSTDAVDGNLARKRNEVTILGKFLDPIADKLIVMSALILLTFDRVMGSPYIQIIVILILGREFLVTALRQVAASKGVVIAADKSGKIKAVLQDVAISILIVVAWLIAHYPTSIVTTIFEVVGYTLITIATILTIQSGVNYISKNKNVF